jgi:hypothetical protein
MYSFSPGAIYRTASLATGETTAVAKTSAGNLYSVFVVNQNAAIRWLQFFDAAAAPTGGAVPLFSYPIPASGSLLLGNTYYGPKGLPFVNGLVFAVSTTPATYTAATPANHFLEIQFS